MRRPVHCNKNNIVPLGLLKTFVIPQMEDVNINAADDGQLETLRGEMEEKVWWGHVRGEGM